MTKPKYTRGRKIESVHDLIDCISIGCFIYRNNHSKPMHPAFLNNWSLHMLRRLSYDAYVAKERGLLDDFTSAERDVLRQLFKNGPTWDGNIASKAGRSTLFSEKLAEYHNGYTQLTLSGLKRCLEDGMRNE